MRAGAGLMQIQAGIPVELVDVLQATILLFLVAEPGPAPAVPAARRQGGHAARPQTITRTYGSEAASLMDAAHHGLYGIPVLGLLFQLVGYLIAIVPPIAPIILQPATPLALGGAVRRHVRAVGRRQHRHRGDDARGGLHRLGRRRRRSRRVSAHGPAPLFGITPALLIGARSRRSLSAVLISPLHAWLSISVRADQIISGTIINIAAVRA